MTSDNSDDDKDEMAIFRQAVSDAAPLDNSNRHHFSKKPRPPKPDMTERDHAEVMAQLLDPPPGWLEDYDLSTGEELSYRLPGVQINTLRKLRRGQYRVEAELDLHGCTVKSARQELSAFLLEARHQAWRCVRIIHGKGRGSGNRGPVLKASVDYWLRQRQEVAAFCSAQAADGGTGAAYVLLRNPAKLNQI